MPSLSISCAGKVVGARGHTPWPQRPSCMYAACRYPSKAAVLKTLAAAVLPHCISACLAGDLAHRRTGCRVVQWCEGYNIYAICLELERSLLARAAHQAPRRRAAAASPGHPLGGTPPAPPPNPAHRTTAPLLIRQLGLPQPRLHVCQGPGGGWLRLGSGGRGAVLRYGEVGWSADRLPPTGVSGACCRGSPPRPLMRCVIGAWTCSRHIV